MKDEVIVNGVKLTREQVERALDELNAPPPVFSAKPNQVMITGKGKAVFFFLDPEIVRSSLAAYDKNQKNVVLAFTVGNGEVFPISHSRYSGYKYYDQKSVTVVPDFGAEEL